jgi:hypothetical protein
MLHSNGWIQPFFLHSLCRYCLRRDGSTTCWYRQDRILVYSHVGLETALICIVGIFLSGIDVRCTLFARAERVTAPWHATRSLAALATAVDLAVRCYALLCAYSIFLLSWFPIIAISWVNPMSTANAPSG